MSDLTDFINQCNNNLTNTHTDEVNKALSYLTDHRKVSLDSITKHQIGYCPLSFSIPESICHYGKDKEDRTGRGYAYSIEGHIIVPIYEEFGDIVGFATRKPTTEPGNSWWNLPFKKGSHLYLLNKNRKDIFKNNKIYLVEGYIDAIILAQEGLPNVCAIMGIALTPRKTALIARYCNNVCFCLDIDANQSGQKAQAKSIHALSEFGFCESISVINNLPVGQDPDVYVMENGLNELLRNEKVLSDKDIKAIRKQVISESKRN